MPGCCLQGEPAVSLQGPHLLQALEEAKAGSLLLPHCSWRVFPRIRVLDGGISPLTINASPQGSWREGLGVPWVGTTPREASKLLEW